MWYGQSVAVDSVIPVTEEDLTISIRWDLFGSTINRDFIRKMFTPFFRFPAYIYDNEGFYKLYKYIINQNHETNNIYFLNNYTEGIDNFFFGRHNNVKHIINHFNTNLDNIVDKYKVEHQEKIFFYECQNMFNTS